MSCYLAIDIGASSGRHIVGRKDKDGIVAVEVYRFPNGMVERDGHLIWDINALYNNVLEGIKVAFSQHKDIVSLSIDTWGVDYVLMQGDKAILPAYAYRDSRTEQAIDKVHSIVPFSELYAATGIQFQSFNTIYQLYADKTAGRLDEAEDMLMIPEYLMYKLCGIKAREYTNATTGGLVDAATGQFHKGIIEKLGLPERLFPRLCAPGSVLGELKPEIAQYVGGNCKVVLCATHDTGSAVEGIPMQGNSPYISSGTWSLLGVKTDRAITTPQSEAANYSNEGGVGYNRFQKNIMGMWIVNNLKSELCPEADFGDILLWAEQSDIKCIVDANAPEFLAPKSMAEAINKAAGGRLKSVGDYFRCAFLSLAESYRLALEEMESITGESYRDLYIVGGGAKNKLLNKMTAAATGKNVIALPIEATALGNLKIQSEVN